MMAVIFLVLASAYSPRLFFFFFNDTATTEIYTLSLHDALPILCPADLGREPGDFGGESLDTLYLGGGTPSLLPPDAISALLDRKSTRLNSSHGYISYAVFCLKKKNIIRKVRERKIPHPSIRATK